MPIVLKPELGRDPMLTCFFTTFNDYRSNEENEKNPEIFFSNLIKIDSFHNMLENSEIEDIDKKIELIDYTSLQFPNNNSNLDNRKTYGEFYKFLVELRTSLLKYYNKDEKEVVLDKQKRVVSPAIEAYDWGGNNNLEIKDSKTGYSYLFD